MGRERRTEDRGGREHRLGFLRLTAKRKSAVLSSPDHLQHAQDSYLRVGHWRSKTNTVL